MTSYPRNRQHSSALNSVERRKAVGGGGQTSQHSRLFDFSKPQEKLTKEDIDEYRRRNIEETPYSYNGKPLAITHFKQPGQQDRPFGSKVKLTSDELRRQKLLRQAQWNRDRAAEQDDISLEALRITDKRADKAVAKKKQLPTQLVGERRAEVDAALRDPRFYSKVARQEASANDIRLLGPGKWLNDEVINFYGAMIQQRADAEKKRKVYFLNSFFWAKLIGQGYEKGKLGKWTKTVNVFDLDILVFPININNNHWVCGAINFKDKRFEYYDSFTSSPPQKVYQTMRNYIQQESRAKRQKDFDFEGWEDYWDHGAPQQQNLYDCGVFTCQTIEHRARGVGDKGQSVTGDNPFEFKQENMEYIRSLMVWEIKHGKLDDRAHSS